MKKCPICNEATVAEYRPFCSRRCADVDLGKWMTGSYAIPSAEPLEPEEFERAVEDAHRADDREDDGPNGRLH